MEISDAILRTGTFDMANYMTIEQIDARVKEKRSQVMYRDESKVE